MIAMRRDGVSLTLAVGAAPYQKTLAASLLRARMLRRFMSAGAYLEIQDPNNEGVLEEIKRFPLNRAVNRVAWGVWRRLPQKLRPPSPVMLKVLLADHLQSRWVPECSVFHGWMGQSLASMRVAKEKEAATLVENVGRHPRHFYKASWEECDRFNIPAKDRSPLLPEALIRRMEREYEICDAIAVPSKIAHASFAEFEYEKKAIVVLPGVDAEFFSPRAKSESRTLFRVCFAGRVELAKGAGYLLQAWKKLALPNAELVLAGEVRPEMKELLRTQADSSVRVAGVLTAAELAEVHRSSDVFAFPSVNEGLAMVLLEAMASGLAVVASELSGAADCVSEGKEGFVTPARDVDRLVEAIRWCYEHREETRAMGFASRARVEREFTLEHYNQRMIAVYRRVAGTTE
jgi:glycosyltransferase involved in cell wall biosynthesis